MGKIVRFAWGSLVLASVGLLFLGAVLVSADPSSGGISIQFSATPDRPVAAELTRLTVTLKDQGLQPVSNATVSIAAEKIKGNTSMEHMGTTSDGQTTTRITASAKPAARSGAYLAGLKFPEDGDWKITVTGADATAQFDITVAEAGASNRTYVNRIAGDYALEFSMEGHHATAGTEKVFDLTVTDRWTGAPIEGLNVEVIPVQISLGTGDEHGGEMAMSTNEAANSNNEADEIQAITAQEQEDVTGVYQVRHTFTQEGNHVFLVRIGANQRELMVSIPVNVEAANAHDAQTSVPNYWFVGSLLGMILVTIVTVPVLRRRQLKTQPAGVS